MSRKDSRVLRLFAALVMLVAVGSGAAAATGATAPATPAASPEVIARVDQEIITRRDLDEAVAATVGPERLEYRTAEPLRGLVETLIDRKLMAHAAQKAGLDQDAVVKSRLDAPADDSAIAREHILAEVYLERELAKVPTPTEAEISRYYREHPGEFTVPARVRVTRVLIATAAAGERMRTALAQGATFEALQQQDAEHTLRMDQVWLQDSPKKGEMETIALGLQPGEVSGVFPTATGFAVLRAEERRAAQIRPLGDVAPGIRARMEDERRQAAASRIRAQLREGVTVTIDDEALSAYLKSTAAGH
jgi:parvulin-like peptidyl-prolyl isomerase